MLATPEQGTRFTLDVVVEQGLAVVAVVTELGPADEGVLASIASESEAADLAAQRSSAQALQLTRRQDSAVQEYSHEQACCISVARGMSLTLHRHMQRLQLRALILAAPAAAAHVC